MRWDRFTPVSGVIGILSAFTVAIRQIIPEHELGFPFLKTRVKYLPLLFFLLQLLLTLINLSSLGHLLFVTNSLYLSWLYLRFVQKKSDASRGDLSESFAFANGFPEIVRPFVQSIANVCSLVFGMCIPRLKMGASASGVGGVGGTAGLQRSQNGSEKGGAGFQWQGNNTDEMDAERRRQRANVALEERLKSKNMSNERRFQKIDGMKSGDNKEDRRQEDHQHGQQRQEQHQQQMQPQTAQSQQTQSDANKQKDAGQQT